MSIKTRLLFVDDESNIRLTLPAILNIHGFDVTVAATVGEALAFINNETFDVLLSDLNIGQPGDGFVVVSAMRRIQPNAVTIIITGYPAFESALEAIRNQVDDYVTKPADIPKLVQTIRQKVVNRQPYRSIVPKRLSAIMRQNQEEIIEHWLAGIGSSSEMSSVRLSRNAWSGKLPQMLLAAIAAAESQRSRLTKETRKLALEHGELRRKQGFSAPMLAEEVRILLVAIGTTIQTHLLSVDLSEVIPDLLAAADYLDLILRESLRALSGVSQAQRA